MLHLTVLIVDLVMAATPSLFPTMSPILAWGLYGIAALLTVWLLLTASWDYLPKRWRFPLIVRWGGMPDRIPLLAFCEKAVSAGWNLDAQQGLDTLDLMYGIRQAALDGTIKLWGKFNSSMVESLTLREPLAKIPQSHWEEFEIDIFTLMQPNNEKTRTYSPRRFKDWGRHEAFIDLHLDRPTALRWLRADADKYRGHIESTKRD